MHGEISSSFLHQAQATQVFLTLPNVREPLELIIGQGSMFHHGRLLTKALLLLGEGRSWRPVTRPELRHLNFTHLGVIRRAHGPHLTHGDLPHWASEDMEPACKFIANNASNSRHRPAQDHSNARSRGCWTRGDIASEGPDELRSSASWVPCALLCAGRAC